MTDIKMLLFSAPGAIPRLPDKGNPVPEHVAVWYLPQFVLQQVQFLFDILI
jgi:hypothetical protein